MIRRGAAHYDRFCANCHASPDRPDLGDELALTPPPPKLHLRVEGWPPEILFATVKRGIANTAMPSWPSQNRDDEVWAMVAFLTALPKLEVAAYRELAGLDVAAPAAPLTPVECIRCHGADGRGFPDGAFPRLDIQTEPYLFAQLRAFRDATRESGFMQSAVSGLHDEELAALAAYFAGTSPSLPAGAPPLLVAKGIPHRKIPACSACHGPPSPARPEFPTLTGQYQSYLLAQLRLFADGRRGGGPFVSLMHTAAQELTISDIVEAADWYGTQSQ
jgi:cytochrome c553